MTILRTQNNCLGLDMQDGTHYSSGRRGTVHVERPDHLKSILRSDAAQRYDGIKVASFGTNHVIAVTRRCPKCFFAPWSWKEDDGNCPRCGTAIVADEEIPADDLQPGFV